MPFRRFLARGASQHLEDALYKKFMNSSAFRVFAQLNHAAATKFARESAPFQALQDAKQAVSKAAESIGIDANFKQKFNGVVRSAARQSARKATYRAVSQMLRRK